MTPRFPATFASLQTRNFRLFASGQVVSNTGAWMQRIAQDWLVLTLTGSATAVGITTAMQFLPTLMFGLVGGMIADRYSKRRILQLTQVGQASMAGTLAVLTLTHHIVVWHVYLIAFGLGLVTAVDNPTRQSFVNEMVGPHRLPNAISINSSVFQLGALVGPAVSGVLVNAVGAGWAFAINAVSYVAPFVALSRMRPHELITGASSTRSSGGLREGLRHMSGRPDLLWPTVLAGVFGLFTINLPVTLAAYAKTVFHSGAGGYGLLSSVVALGSLAGALVSATRPRPRLRVLIIFAAALATVEVVAALTPGQAGYCVALLGVGAGTLLLLTSANAAVQLAAHDTVRGRVMGVYLFVFIGAGAVGGPVVGAIDQHLGPQTGMLLAGLVPAAVTALVAAKLARDGQLRLRLSPALHPVRLVSIHPR